MRLIRAVGYGRRLPTPPNWNSSSSDSSDSDSDSDSDDDIPAPFGFDLGTYGYIWLEYHNLGGYRTDIYRMWNRSFPVGMDFYVIQQSNGDGYIRHTRNTMEEVVSYIQERYGGYTIDAGMIDGVIYNNGLPQT